MSYTKPIFRYTMRLGFADQAVALTHAAAAKPELHRYVEAIDVEVRTIQKARNFKKQKTYGNIVWNIVCNWIVFYYRNIDTIIIKIHLIGL
jgi:hypothetical protein